MNPQHQIFDGLVPDIPTSRQLHRLLDAIVKATGLTAFSPVDIHVHNPHWCAYVLIAESHISAHGDGKQGHIDVFSCARFDAMIVYQLICDALGGEWSCHRIERAVESG